LLESFDLTDRGCVRNNNEDYCQVDRQIGLYVLADGMGGARAGEHASRMAVETLIETLRAAPERNAPSLLAAVEEANRRVREASQRDPSLEGMGTTLVAALETNGRLAIASVGDSRAYIFDAEGFRLITEDQSWVNEVGRPLGLDAESLRTHPMRHVLTMAIGAGSRLSVNMYMTPLEPGAVVLLSTDGLHGVVSAARLEENLRGARDGESLTVCGRRLVAEAIRAGGPDNVTIVLMRKPA
jgi:PPM family protein phosphatase